MNRDLNGDMSHDGISDGWSDEDLLAVLALDALDADERAEAELHLHAMPIDRAADLGAAVAALADSVATPPPGTLRADSLAVALQRREALRPVDAATPCAPVEAYRRMADGLLSLLDSLTGADWDAPAHASYGPVRAVIAHLVGVEELTLAWVGARPSPDPSEVADHVEATRSVVDALAATGPATLAARWRALTDEVVAVASTVDPSLPVLAHDLPTDVDGLLVLRTFELFAHTHDLATAIVRPPPVPDAPTLALMSTRLMAALPLAIALRGTTVPGGTARIVLAGDTTTASAGGCYDVPLDPTTPAGPADVVITADIVDICLLAARRRAADVVAADLDGDQSLAAVVLAAVDAFARD